MDLFVGAYWGARPESREECATRVSRFLSQIAQKRPEFSAWHRLARTKKKALESRIGLSVEEVQKALTTHRGDIDKKPIPELGYIAGLWNGRDDAGMRLFVTCGCYSERVSNAVVLDLPKKHNNPDLFDPNLLLSLLVDIVDAFDPDDAVVTSSEYTQEHVEEWRASKCGWFVYRRGEDIVENKEFPTPG
jgi:hypothetical protein